MSHLHRKSEGDIRRRFFSPGNLNWGSDLSDQSEDDKDFIPSSGSPKTYIIICVNSATKPETIRWIVDKIRGKRDEGGAELIVRQQGLTNKEQDIMLHVSASKIKLLESAEQLELQKKDKDRRLRDFSVTHLEDFLVNDEMTVDDLLTTSEKQTIVKHELENIRAMSYDHHLPGYHTYSLYEGQPILQVCLENNIITQIYPLHEKDLLKKLGAKWYEYRSFLKNQPIEEIRLYFGEAIALYFTFLGFYTTALLIPMVLGFIQLLLASTESVPFFCVFNVVWTTIFLEIWKRRSNELAYNWGTIGMTSMDEPRPNYHGPMGKDPVSGKMQPQYPSWKTNAKMCVSIPLVIICMIFAFIIMLASFWCEEYVKNIESSYASILLQLPSIIYNALVYVMNELYRKLATYLTEWENHRTQSQFDRHRVTKLVLFEFVNNFMSLFYVAFIIQDLEMLRNQLAVMLVLQQAFNHFQEALLPYILRKISTLRRNKPTKDRKPKMDAPLEEEYQNLLPSVHLLSEDDTQCKSAEKEYDMERYAETFDDYLEMFVQFGYVVLFSSVYPIAAFWAVLNNLIEIRADAFKLCRVYQRPMAKKIKNIGAWQRAFEIVGVLSIMTNLGVLALSPTMQTHFGFVKTVSNAEFLEDGSEIIQRPISTEVWILAFVLMEHILLGLRFFLHKAIPETPRWVRVELARKMYESRRALKNERNQKSRHILTRRFKTVHGPHNKQHK